MSLLPIAIAGFAVGYFLTKQRSGTLVSVPKTSNIRTKFPGYEIQKQIIYLTDSKKAKDYAFCVGKNEPESYYFKKVFGADNTEYIDAFKNDPYNYDRVYLIVKTKEQQQSVYFLMCYLFAGAAKTNPHRIGAYADIINSYVSFINKLFNAGFPIIKSIEEAKLLFDEFAKKV